MSKTFKPGDIVWNTRGQQGRYVARVDDGHVVQPCYVDGFDGDADPPEVYVEGCEVWPTVHDKEPRAVVAPGIAELEQRLAALRREIAEAEALKLQADRDTRAVKERLAEHDALQHLDGLLNNTVTHYVVQRPKDDGKQWAVLTAQEFHAIPPYGYRERYLTLWAHCQAGKTALQWKLSIGGTDGTREVYPFTNEADARAKLVEIVTTAAIKAIPKQLDGAYAFDLLTAIDTCQRSGVNPPAEAVAAMAEIRRLQAEKSLANARTALMNAEAELAKLNGSA